MARVEPCNDKLSGPHMPGVDIIGEHLHHRAHLSADEWRRFRADVKAGRYDALYPDWAYPAVAVEEPDSGG